MKRCIEAAVSEASVLDTKQWEWGGGNRRFK